MKVAPTLIVAFKDADGFGAAFSDALQSNPNSPLRRLEESFELSLERYGIKDRKASGGIVHFADQDGNYQVTLMLLQNYEPPVLACAVNEILVSIIEDNPSTIPTIFLPVIVSASKLKPEKNYPTTSNRDQIYGALIGPESDTTKALLAKCEKPPPYLQIYSEPVACFIQLARVSNFPTCVLIGQSGQRQSQKNIGDELEVVHLIGELLASISSSLCFLREKIGWTPRETLKEVKEPWQALYG